MSDDNFFAMAPADGAEAPADAPPVIPDGEQAEGGFTLLGEAPPPADAPMLGDVSEVPPADMGFAAEAAPDAFAAPPPAEEMDAFAAPPPEEEAPIILGAPPAEAPPAVEDDIVVTTEEDEEEEPVVASAMQKWNEEWMVTLATRKDEENAAKADSVEASRLHMENFHKEREAKREGRMTKNREDEQGKLEAIEADLENDNSWQRMCKMVELSHDGAADREDTKRMRDVLILLKNEPARAAVVGA